MSPPLEEEENNVEHATVINLEEKANKLLQDVTDKSGKEVLPESHSNFHALAVKACGISSKSGLIVHKSVPPGLLSCLRLKQRAVSSFYSGGFGYILCPPQLHEQRVNNVENINLQDAVLTINPVTTIGGSVKEAKASQDKLTKASQEKQTYPQVKNKLNRGRGSFYNHDVPEIPVILDSKRNVPDTRMQPLLQCNTRC